MSTEQDYGHDYESDSNRMSHRTRREAAKRELPKARRTGKSPQSINGIHKRRRRKMSW
ncbi:MAG: hypothetical protein AAFV43_03105 [Planctomycetota bacterium]